MDYPLRTALAACLVALAACGDKSSQAASDPDQPTTTDALADAGAPAMFLGNDTCPTTGKDVDQDEFLEVDGQRVYFCCPKCKAKAEADPAATLAKAYPVATPVGNTTCPVSDEPVEEGNSVTWQGHQISTCCPKCEKAFAKDAQAFTAQALAEAK